MNRWTVALCLVWLPLAAKSVPRLAPLTIGRLHYDGGGDWYAGPSALPNLLAALRQRTALPVAERERVVTLTGPELWDVPYLFMTGHGNVHFSDEEVKRLRRWLEQGASCTPTTTTAWTSRSAERSRGCSPITPWLKSR